MTNEELVDKVVSMFIVEDTLKIALKTVVTAMAIMKDHQLKEYLKNKRTEFESERGTLRFGGDVLDEITNELFPE